MNGLTDTTTSIATMPVLKRLVHGLIALLACLSGLSVPALAESPLPMMQNASLAAAEWLMRQPAGGFTLQIITVSSAEQVQGFVDREEALAPHSLATFRYQRGDDLLYALTLGIFASAEEAFAVRGSLQMAHLSETDMWVRPLEDVKRSIRTTLQK